MKEKPSDKFICLERHGFLAVIVGIIPPEKRNIAILIGEDAVIADGDPVGISAEVLENTLGATEGRLAIDNPLLLVKLSQEAFPVVWRIGSAGKDKIAFSEAMFEVVKKLAAEQRRHDFNVKEESLAAWYPAAAVRG